MAGSMMGKVWITTWDTQKSENPNGFSDEGVRFLYCDKQCIFITYTDTCQQFWRTKPNSLVQTRYFSQFDTHGSLKYVLQRGPQACLLFPNTCVEFNLIKGQSHKRAFKLSELGGVPSEDVAPCDYDGERLCCVHRADEGATPCFRVVVLEPNTAVDIDDLPRAREVTLAKLWGTDHIAYIVGSLLRIYNYKERRSGHILRGHRREIVALFAEDELIITSLSADAVVKMWNAKTGVCLHTFFVPEATFSFGYPYCVAVQERRIVLAADQGVFMLEFDEEGKPKSATV